MRFLLTYYWWNALKIIIKIWKINVSILNEGPPTQLRLTKPVKKSFFDKCSQKWMHQAEAEHLWHTGFTLDNSVFVCAGLWVHMHQFLSLSLWVCACKSPGVCFWFPAGELCVTEQLTHQFRGLGRLQDLCRDKKTKKESGRQTLLSSVFTVFYKV